MTYEDEDEDEGEGENADPRWFQVKDEFDVSPWDEDDEPEPEYDLEAESVEAHLDGEPGPEEVDDEPEA